MRPNPNSPVIVEYNPSGHHLFYVRLLLEGLVERGIRPVLATSQLVVDSPEWRVHLASWTERIEVRIGRGRDLDVHELQRVVSAAEAGLAVVPDGDQLAVSGAALRRLHGHPVRLLIMRDTAVVPRFPPLSPVKTLIKRAQLRIASLVPGIELVRLRPSTSMVTTGYRVALDPVVFIRNDASIAAARAKLRRAGAPDHWVAVLGAITRRKNVPLVAAAMRRIPAEQVGLLVAGRVLAESTDEVARAMSELISSGYPVLVDDRDLPEAELDAYVSAADVVVLAHSNEGPSGLLGKSLAAGTSVLAAGAASLRRDVAGRPEAAAWVPLDAAAIAAGLLTAFERHPAPAHDLGSHQFIAALLDDQLVTNDPRSSRTRSRKAT